MWVKGIAGKFAYGVQPHSIRQFYLKNMSLRMAFSPEMHKTWVRPQPRHIASLGRQGAKQASAMCNSTSGAREDMSAINAGGK
jgi:hypothetical protein